MTEPTMYTPADWGAFSNPEAKGVALSLPLNRAIIHTFAGASFLNKSVAQVMVYLRAIEKYHVNDRGFASIGYNFMVDEQGIIYIGRGWLRSAAHTADNNRTSFGISMLGHGDKDAATAAQVSSTQWLLGEGVRLGHLTKDFTLHGHREYSNKSCPGDLIYPLVQSGAFMPSATLPPTPTPTPESTIVTVGSLGETPEDFVMSCYLVHLGRFATKENVAFWVKNFSLTNIEREISGSPEALLRKDDTDWLNYLLDRLLPKLDLDRGAMITDLNDHKLSRLGIVQSVKTAVILSDVFANKSDIKDPVDTTTILNEITRRLANG